MKIGPITIDKQGCLDAGMSERTAAKFIEGTELSYLLAVAAEIDPLFVSCIIDGIGQQLMGPTEAIAMAKRLIANGAPLTEIRIVRLSDIGECDCAACASESN